MDLNIDSVVMARDSVFSTTVDDDLVLFNPDDGQYFGSGTVGMRIWSMISEKRKVAEICGSLATEFEVDAERCEHDVLQFLASLRERDLITVS